MDTFYSLSFSHHMVTEDVFNEMHKPTDLFPLQVQTKSTDIARQLYFNFNLFVNLQSRSNEIIEIYVHRSVVQFTESCCT